MIFVTLGTMYLDFPRLVDAMDEIARDSGEDVVIQTGMAQRNPQYARHFAFAPREEIHELIRQSRVVVTHAGIGSVIDVLRAGRPLVVVPRLKRYGEHNNDHQLDLAEAIVRRGWGRMVTDIRELPDACRQPPSPCAHYQPAKTPLVEAIRETIRGAAGVSA